MKFFFANQFVKMDANRASRSLPACRRASSGLKSGLLVAFCALLCLQADQGQNPPDTDGDGLPDAWELANNLNPLDPVDAFDDLDGDDLDHYLEYVLGTDPQSPGVLTPPQMAWLVADQDADGVSNALEAGLRLNYTLAETVPGTPDATAAALDTDDDGMPDRWESVRGLDPLDPTDALDDSDEDEVANLQEYQRAIHPQDWDADGMPNEWENWNALDPLAAHDAVADMDSDGLSNLREFQLGTYAEYNDSDSDSLPDGWEVSMGLDPLRWNLYDDSDADGLDNVHEYQAGTNPGHPDSDGDGFKDGWEHKSGMNPLAINPDTDQDGLPDSWEVTMSMNPNQANNPDDDADGDGLSTAQEFAAGTLPGNIDSDGDTVNDGEDVVANEPLLNWKKAPETKYAVIDLGSEKGNMHLNNKGHVVGITSDGEFATPHFWDGEWREMHHQTEFEDPIYSRENLIGEMLSGFSDDDVLYSWVLGRGPPEARETVAKWASPDAYPIYDYPNTYTFVWARFGHRVVITSGGWTGTGWSPDDEFFNIPSETMGTFTNWGGGIAITRSGFYTTTNQDDGLDYVGGTALPGPAASVMETPGNEPLIQPWRGVPPQRLHDGQWQALPLPIIHEMDAQGVALMYDGKIWRNGQVHDLENLIKPSPSDDPEWVNIQGGQCNNHGVILAAATKAETSERHSVLLVPTNTEQVTFHGNHIVKKDDGTGDYDGADWNDNNSDGDADDADEHHWPLCSVKGDTMGVSAKLAFPMDSAVPMTIRARIAANSPASAGAEIIFGPSSPITPANRMLDCPRIEAATPIDSSRTNYLENMELIWEVQASGSTQWTEVSKTSHSFYALYRQPVATSRLFHTVLHLACSRPGATNWDSVVSDTWDNFKGPANVKAWNPQTRKFDRSLHYYKTGIAQSNVATTVEGLLKEENGQCGSWAQLMLDSMSIQGLPTTSVSVDAAHESLFLVKSWQNNTPSGRTGKVELPTAMDDLSCSLGNVVYGDMKSLDGIAGQNTATPYIKIFGSHALVTYDYKYYDPSYGVMYTDVDDFEDKAIDIHGSLQPPENQGEQPTIINLSSKELSKVSFRNIPYVSQ